MEQITSSRSFAGIFPPALRSLWSPITPSSQAKSARRLTALTVTFIIKQALNVEMYGYVRGIVPYLHMQPVDLYMYVVKNNRLFP